MSPAVICVSYLNVYSSWREGRLKGHYLGLETSSTLRIIALNKETKPDDLYSVKQLLGL